MVFHQRVASALRSGRWIIFRDFQARVGNGIAAGIVRVETRVKRRKAAVLFRKGTVDIPSQSRSNGQIAAELVVVVHEGANGIRTVVAIRRTLERVTTANISFQKSEEGSEVERVGIRVVIDDVQLRVVPHHACTNSVLPVDPIQS